MLIAFAAALALAVTLGAPLIGLLRRLAYKQQAYEDAPQTHQKKTGTPTMGGLLFLIAPLVALAVSRDAVTAAYAFLIAGNLAIGFADDYAAIRRGRNRGLGARAKFLATTVVAAIFLAIVLVVAPPAGTMLFAGAAPLWLW